MGRPKGSKNQPRVTIAELDVLSQNTAKLQINQTDKRVSVGFSVTELCRIMKSAQECNVREFRMGALSLSFGEKTTEPGPQDLVLREDLKSKAEILREELDREARREQLMIDDPIAYENEQMEALSQGM